MITVAIFVVSLILLGQFGLFYWRTMMLSGASAELSERIAKLGSAAQSLEAVVCLHRACPGYGMAERIRMATARSYHGAMRLLVGAARRMAPGLASWAEQEMATCVRYAAVRLDIRLARAENFAASARSFS